MFKAYNKTTLLDIMALARFVESSRCACLPLHYLPNAKSCAKLKPLLVSMTSKETSSMDCTNSVEIRVFFVNELY